MAGEKMSETSREVLDAVARADRAGYPWRQAARALAREIEAIEAAAAQQWRPLTSDPATWPKEGQWIVAFCEHGNVSVDEEYMYASRVVNPGHYFECGWTHWRPLDPPEVT